MAESHVISALRAKRAEISGHVRDLEKRVKRWRTHLAHIDATIRVFAPTLNPDSIPPKLIYRRTRYFAHGELYRHCLDMLRKAEGEPLAAVDIAKAIMRTKRLSVDDDALVRAITNTTLVSIKRLESRNMLIKTGTSRNTRWALKNDAGNGLGVSV